MYKNITILNFSSRNNGNCAAISLFISNFHANSNICVYNINEYFAPCSNCSYECLRQSEICPRYAKKKEIMDTILSSRMVYYIVPNFCGFPCANYFAFNEGTVGYFNLDKSLMEKYMAVSKKFIIVSNSESNIFVQAMKQQSVNPKILYLKTRKYGVQSINSDLIESEAAKMDLLSFLNCSIESL